jgi:hypothetical protein
MGLAVLRAGLSSDAELIQSGWRIGSTAADVGLCARVMGRLGQPRSLGTEGRVLGVLLGAVEACLAAYPSSLQQDLDELAQLEAAAAAGAEDAQQQQQQQVAGGLPEDGQQGRQQQQQQQAGAGPIDLQRLIRISILKGLVSEKEALVGSQGVLQDWQQQLQQLVGGSSGPVKPEQLEALGVCVVTFSSSPSLHK